MSKSVTVNTSKELGKALADKADEIRIEGALAETVIAFQRIPQHKWGIAYGCVAGAIAAAAGGVTLPAVIPIAAFAVIILGYDLVTVAISIGVAAKSPLALNVLQKHYREVERGETHLVLKRR